MMNRRRGFTLVELLVAISILAIVAVLGWRGLDSIIRARTSLNDDLAETRGLQLAFAQMQSDCSQIATAANIGNRPPLLAEEGRLTLVRMVFAENQPSRVQVVAYRLRDGALTRRESVATRDLKELDVAWAAALGDTDPASAVVLHSSIGDMAIRTWVAGTGWRVPGQAVPVGQAPDGQTETGVEVALQLRGRPTSLTKVFLLGAA